MKLSESNDLWVSKFKSLTKSVTLSNVRIFYPPHQVVTCQQHNMYSCNFLDYERVIARIYSKETVVNFICLNKEFVIVIT